MEQLGLLFAAMFAPVNLGYTILLIVVIIYWALVIIGALGIDLFDVDAEVDSDVDVDMDADVDVDADADLDADADADGSAEGGGHHGGALHGLLLFFNLGEVPLMVVASVMILSMWAVAMTLNVVLDNQSLLLSVPLFLGNIVVSAFVAKVITAPIKKVFRALDKDADASPDDNVLGRTCVITTREATETFGQAVIETDGSPIILNVITCEGETIKKGQEAVVIEYIKDKRVYTVKSRWDKEA